MLNDVSLSAAKPSSTASPTPALGLTPFRVFHVNDSTDDQIIFQAACRRAEVPFNWHVADSANKGISYLKTLVEQSTNLPVCWPDLVLLDISMPRVSGFEVLKYIRATPQLKHIPVIILTGCGHPRNEADAFRFGATAFRTKPLHFQEIVTLARELFQLLQELKRQPRA